MTPIERAEKIVQIVKKWQGCSKTHALSEVASQISEAEREAVNELAATHRVFPEVWIKGAYTEGFRAAKSEYSKAISDAYASGFSEAKEKAKGIAEQGDRAYPFWTPLQIAQCIGEMEP